MLGHGMFLVGMLRKLSTGVKSCTTCRALVMLVLMLLRMDTGVFPELSLSLERGAAGFAFEQFLHGRICVRVLICRFP